MQLDAACFGCRQAVGFSDDTPGVLTGMTA